MAEDIHWKNYTTRFRVFPLNHDHFEGDDECQMIICIPVYAEPEIIMTIRSILECSRPDIKIEVILLFNKGLNMTSPEKEIHAMTWNECQWLKEERLSNISFVPISIDAFPDPKGGVGWARKVAMDEAARRLGPEGIIVCLDADCTVQSDYLMEIWNQFRNHQEFEAASIYFEHKTEDLDEISQKRIIDYELHLRYLIEAQRWCGHPHAFHTVGSSMAVKRSAYLKSGGMNTRHAGEDFYFLQKFIEINSLFEINTTTVYPSARVSGRVPFGTGRAMQQMEKEDKEWATTNFQTFKLIKPLFDGLDRVYQWLVERKNFTLDDLPSMVKLTPEVTEYLGSIKFEEEVFEIFNNTKNYHSFRKRFFRYFNAFQMIKYFNSMHQYYPNVPVKDAVGEILSELNLHNELCETNTERLKLLRERHLSRKLEFQ